MGRPSLLADARAVLLSEPHIGVLGRIIGQPRATTEIGRMVVITALSLHTGCLSPSPTTIRRLTAPQEEENAHLRIQHQQEWHGAVRHI